MMITEERYTADELVRMARRCLLQYRHTTPSGGLRSGGLSTPDLIYYLAKHIERHCTNEQEDCK
jgi:hypothetical protein